MRVTSAVIVAVWAVTFALFVRILIRISYDERKPIKGMTTSIFHGTYHSQSADTTDKKSFAKSGQHHRHLKSNVKDEFQDEEENDSSVDQQQRSLHYRNIAPRHYHRKGGTPGWKRQRRQRFKCRKCRCPYPGELPSTRERPVRFSTELVLPYYHKSCQNIQYLCPGETASGPLWKCPLKKKHKRNCRGRSSSSTSSSYSSWSRDSSSSRQNVFTKEEEEDGTDQERWWWSRWYNKHRMGGKGNKGGGYHALKKTIVYLPRYHYWCTEVLARPPKPSPFPTVSPTVEPTMMPTQNMTNTKRLNTVRTLFSRILGNDDDVSNKDAVSLVSDKNAVSSEDDVSIKGKDASIEEDASIITGPNPCDRIDFRVPDDPEGRRYCLDYEALPYVHPACHGINQTVPKIYHSVGAGMQKYHQMATALSNPDYKRNHHDDDSALVYIAKHCGPEAAAAYSCITPPAYRADIFRFCALFAEGGVYLDEDMLPAVPLDDLYSPCAAATIGHDSPQNGHPGKQMKILAGQPGAEIFKCALERSVDNINSRRYPRRGPLALTGPLLLHDCYEMHSDSVAVVYHDSRNAKWPYTGMRAGSKILAVELPQAKHFDGSGVESDPGDYGELFMARKIYRETCVPDEFVFPSIEERIEYYMGSWWQGYTMDEAPYLCGDVHWFNDREKLYGSDQIRESDGEQWLTHGPYLYELESIDGSSAHYYLRDAKQYLASAWHGGEKLRFLMHFGDTVNYYDLPVVVKTRPAGAWKEGLSYPIVAPLEIWRHFDPIALVPGQDTAWHDKSESLVWRGVSSGSRANTIDQVFDRFYPEYVDVGITELVQGDEKIERFKRLLKPALTMKEQLTFKYILSLEGNDVASGLKWQLYSNSVVFMPHPSRVSWAMEDQLVPYYHYIPLEDDLSDIYEKLEWARQNDARCRRIAQHATEYIELLWVSERAQQDTKRILEGMVGKYQQLFGDTLEKCAGESR